MNIRIDTTEEARLRAILQTKNDPESLRLKRYLDMPDLSRTASSPIAELAERILSLPEFAKFDHIQVPEIVPTNVSFDLFDFPADHPARSRSDTYFVDDKNI